jgi:hypothetical protein
MSLPITVRYFRSIAAPLAFWCFAAPDLHAQAPGVPIETDRPRMGDARVLERAKEIREAGGLLSAAQIKEQIDKPMGGAIALPKCGTDPLTGREVAARARAAYLQLGWNYLCQRCERWHLSLAGAYAIAKDAVATCHHCIVPKADMREGYLIAVDHTGAVIPVTAVIARNETMDAAILRVAGGSFSVLPLNDQVAQGDAAYCFSEPLDQEGYFSSGIVNRFLWRAGKRGEPGSIDELKRLRMNVSTDWAPGSSGAAVLDAAGNAIGHVSTISPLREDRAPGGKPGATPAPGAGNEEPPKKRSDRFSGATLLTLHEAVPARGVMALAAEAAKAK